MYRRSNGSNSRETIPHVAVPSASAGLSMALIDSSIVVVGGIQTLISRPSSKSSVSATEMEAKVAVRTSGPPVSCTVPACNTVSQLGARFVQGQQEFIGAPSTDPKNGAPKRPYSPTSERNDSLALGKCLKKRVDRVKVRKGGPGQGGIKVVLIIDVE